MGLLTQTGFVTSDVTCGPSKGLIRCLRRGSKPRVPESVKIDLCRPKIIHDHGDDISYFVTKDFMDLYLTDTWISYIVYIIMYHTVKTYVLVSTGLLLHSII